MARLTGGQRVLAAPPGSSARARIVAGPPVWLPLQRAPPPPCPSPPPARPAPRLRERGRRDALQRPDDPRPAHALGELLARGRDELQLAPAARPGGRARIRRLARGLPPRGAGSLAPLLVAARHALAQLPRARRL